VSALFLIGFEGYLCFWWVLKLSFVLAVHAPLLCV